MPNCQGLSAFQFTANTGRMSIGLQCRRLLWVLLGKLIEMGYLVGSEIPGKKSSQKEV